MNNTGVITTPVTVGAVKANLDLALIGNCSYGALIDNVGTVKWMCLPRFDGDPIFCSLLRRSNDLGFWEISIENFSHSKQYYLKNTGVLVTELHSKSGDAIEITDFAPRFIMYGRAYRPQMLVRIVKPLVGHPRIRCRIRPTFGYGWGSPEKTRGTNHIRYLLPNFSVRVTTNAPISYIVDEVLYEVSEPLHFVMMPDESLKEALPDLVASYLKNTIDYWYDFSSILSIPFEWQEQVLRSCITVKMCAFEETGAIVAALTSSIPSDPEAQGYDLRYCWLRDSSDIIWTLNKLGSTKTMEDFLKYLSNVVSSSIEKEGHIQPCYGIALETSLYEKEMHRLSGYRGLGPVRVGNKDYKQVQNDVYGHVILATTQFFFDHRLKHMGDKLLFTRLEGIGEQAVKKFGEPDSGPLGSGSESAVHTYSSVMCWVAADRLRKISASLNQNDRAKYWGDHASKMHAQIMEKAWSASVGSFTSTFGGNDVDAFLLRLPSVGFISAKDEKFTKTLAHIEAKWKKGSFIVSDASAKKQYGSVVSTLSYINVLATAGRQDEARAIFENVLSKCNAVGLLAETVDLETGEMWGNFPKTTAMVSLVECALRLSKNWEDVI